MICAGAWHRPAPDWVPALAASVVLDDMPAPPRADWFAACPADGDALGNDTHGCCVEAADFRLIEAWLANSAGSDLWKPSLDLVLGRYARLTGYDPATGLNDNGTRTDQDLADFTSMGITLPALQRDFVPWWRRIDPLNDGHLAVGVGECGPALVTLALPRNWAAIEADSGAWAVAPGQGSDWDLCGACHRVLFGRFDGVARWVRSWGRDLAVHPDWWRRYCVAVDLLLDRAWLDARGRSPGGLDLQELMRAMELAG